MRIMNKQQIIIIILGIALLISTQYIILQQWNNEYNQHVKIKFQEGYDLGLEDAITALFKNTNNCQMATISFENSSRTIVDVNCLEIKIKDFQN